jgi:uncharacterized protein (UPF0218 family)
MNIVYEITPELRVKLKEPFGVLIEGTSSKTIADIREMVENSKPSKIISVGDVVSINLHQNGLHPQISIIDNLSKRNQVVKPTENHGEQTFNVNNPQGTITDEAIIAIREALNKNVHTHIVVKGEEDLLTLVAVLYAPADAFVIYGQPHCGVVVVKASNEKKAQVEKLLNEMKASKS